tara:strand:- start:318 stop:1349 length:1032 start_codon:yes stop_codon:yes gene_type:complete
MTEEEKLKDPIQLQLQYSNIDPITGKKKRGRKPKALKEQELKAGIISPPKDTSTGPKKRGRKPKGGKIIEVKNTNLNYENDVIENVILQLKCNVEDLDKDENHVESYYINDNKQELLKFKNIEEDNKINENIVLTKDIQFTSTDNNNVGEDNISSMKQIWKNIKILQKQFHFNETYNSKKACCFWCTCDFSNPPIHIPQNFVNNSYQVYGNFCSPECSVAFLMNEHIDSSQKFERYQLLNYIYGKVYNYSKSIKPAPNPYYLLDKYYGNLTIQEYRKCFDNERLLFVIDKPLTKIMPEIHDESDDLMSINNMSTNSNSSLYQIKRKTNVVKSKANILSTNFGF